MLSNEQPPSGQQSLNLCLSLKQAQTWCLFLSEVQMGDMRPKDDGWENQALAELALKDGEALNSVEDALCNIEAEQAILGALLLNNSCGDSVAGWLRPEHFYEGLHGRLYGAIQGLIKKGRLADGATLQARFATDGDLAEVGGINYLVGLLRCSVGSQQVSEYARNVVELSQRRSLRDTSFQIASLACDHDQDAPEVLAEAETLIAEIAGDNTATDRIETIGEAVQGAIDSSLEAAKCQGGLVGTPSGIQRLDTLTGGWREGHLVIVGARPGMGKSAFVVSAAIDGARRIDVQSGIGVISLEMSSAELAARAISQAVHRQGTRLPYDAFSKGLYERSHQGTIEAAQDDLAALPIYFEDSSGRTVMQIRATARAIDRKFKKQGRRLTCLYIDYLQFIAPDRRYKGNITAEVTQISKDLKALAKGLDIPVIVLSQLNRQVEGRDNHRPFLSDLRDSGSLEQDADEVIFLVRPAYYLERDKPYSDSPKFLEWQANYEAEKHALDLIFAKNRHGPCTDIRLHTEIECNVICDEAPQLAHRLQDHEFPPVMGGDLSNG
jgi:replicative DNA helicase